MTVTAVAAPHIAPDTATVSQRPFKFVSLYSGAGGLDLGFMTAGCVPLLACDNDRHAVAAHNNSVHVWARRMPHLRGCRETALHRDAEDVVAGLAGFDEADLLIGGPPCQGFSVAGRQSPHDPRSRHVHLFVEAVAALKPAMFVMENVPALVEHRRWRDTLNSLRDSARQAGYRTAVWLLDAADHGTPQHRRRMFLIGARTADTELPAPPTPQRTPPVTVRDTFRRLPPHGHPGNDTLCAARIVPARNPVLRASPYAGMMFNGAGRPLNLDRPSSTLPASMGGNRTPIIDQAALDNQTANWAETYHAALTAGEPPLRDTAHIPTSMRRLTVQEAAALQGFPADTQWHGPPSAQWRQIGNSVPPPLAAAIARTCTAALAGAGDASARPAGSVAA